MFSDGYAATAAAAAANETPTVMYQYGGGVGGGGGGNSEAVSTPSTASASTAAAAAAAPAAIPVAGSSQPNEFQHVGNRVVDEQEQVIMTTADAMARYPTPSDIQQYVIYPQHPGAVGQERGKQQQKQNKRSGVNDGNEGDDGDDDDDDDDEEDDVEVGGGGECEKRNRQTKYHLSAAKKAKETSMAEPWKASCARRNVCPGLTCFIIHVFDLMPVADPTIIIPIFRCVASGRYLRVFACICEEICNATYLYSAGNGTIRCFNNYTGECSETIDEGDGEFGENSPRVRKGYLAPILIETYLNDKQFSKRVITKRSSNALFKNQRQVFDLLCDGGILKSFSHPVTPDNNNVVRPNIPIIGYFYPSDASDTTGDISTLMKEERQKILSRKNRLSLNQQTRFYDFF